MAAILPVVDRVHPVPERELRVVAGRPVSVSLEAKARELYPYSPTLQREWIKARTYIGNKKPRVDIGLKRCDITKVFRSLREAGIHAVYEPVQVPQFLSRLIARKP